MYERILVPLDGSKLAEGVLPHAEVMGKQFDAELLLFRAVPTFVQLLQQTASSEPSGAAAELSTDIAHRQLEAETQAAEAYLEGVSRQLRSAGLRAGVHVAEGAAGAAILDCAKQAEVSLIAMSTRGRGGLERVVFGSVADEVLRNTHLPLLLIRAQEQ